MNHERLTHQQRLKLAANLRKRAEEQPGLTPEQRSEARRHADNLDATNRREAKADDDQAFIDSISELGDGK